MVKAQAAMEYLLLLSLAGVLSVAALSFSASQFSVQSEANQQVSALLENVSAFNYSVSGGSPAMNSTEPKLALELSASQPVYAGQPALVQATIYNYGSRTVVHKLLLSSPNSSLSFSNSEKTGAQISFSYSLSSLATVQEAGAYEIRAVALDEYGRMLNSGDGGELSARLAFIALKAPESGPENPAYYALSLAKSNESAAYRLLGEREQVYKVKIFAPPQSEGGRCLNCPPNPDAIWRFITYGPSGNVNLQCACLYNNYEANAAKLSSSPVAEFRISLTAKNRTGSTASFSLSGQKPSDYEAYGSASFAGTPFPLGPNPSSDLVATSPPGKTEWTLRPASSYDDYLKARDDYESRLRTVYDNCGYDCNGAISAALALNSAAGWLLANASGGECTTNSTHALCAPANIHYPPVSLSLGKDFVGGEIPCDTPQVTQVSGITVGVATCN